MSRLIDANHFDNVLLEMIDKNPRKNEYVHHAIKMRNVAINDVRGALFREPTVLFDAVRCRDCNHWKNQHICEAWSRFGTIETTAEQFCSYGEKREE